MKRLAGVVGVASLLFASRARAQDIPNTNWRQTDRPAREEQLASPQNFAFELRFGAYSPEVDEEFQGQGPYQRVFGDGAQFYFGLEFDWQALRIPYVGVIGPAFGWGYTKRSTKAVKAGTNGSNASDVSGEDTSLTIMPMHLSAVLRADEFMRRFGVPLVPYAKLGIGLGLWSASTGGSTSNWGGVEGKGESWGIHGALGLMLSLNWLDERAAISLDQTLGINHTYFFAEWMDTQLDGIGSKPQMHVGSSTWVLGVAADF